jgi:ribose 5-phosphate isomerase B
VVSKVKLNIYSRNLYATTQQGSTLLGWVELQGKAYYNEGMKIFIGADHAGFELKEYLVDFLKNEGHDVVDKGAYGLNESDDYPDFIVPVAKEVAQDPDHRRGIILGGSGQGEAIAANRFKGVRATVYYGGNLDIIKLGRQHNNSNVLSFGARFVTHDEAEKSVLLWLGTTFFGEERHTRRLKKIDQQS